MNFDEPRTMLITCGRGMAALLSHELQALGYEVRSEQHSSVAMRGTLLDAMQLNLQLRTAMSVQYLIDTFTCDDPEQLYRGTRRIAWEDILSPDGYISVSSRVDHPTIDHSLFPSLKVKDAIVDRMMQQCGRRPDAGPERDQGVTISVYWRQQQCRIYINTSGRRLSDRGYRKRPGPAPLQETLAAGLLMTAGYDGTQPLVLPMCGSGTLAIEAALIALHRPPGLLRSDFSFTHLVGFERDRWQQMRNALRRQSQKQRTTLPPIIATDHDPQAIEAAVHNARTAGVDQHIQFSACDIADSPIPDGPPGIVMLNPEYGQRMGDESELEQTYGRIGDFFKQHCKDWTGYVFTGNRELAKHIGLRIAKRHVFFHAGLDCRLLEYELYSGSRRA